MIRKVKLLTKNILKQFHIYDLVRDVWFDFNYKGKARYTLHFKNLYIAYSTEDSYSKKWFYPRYLNRVHEPALLNQLVHELTQSDCFIDIGANLGFFTCVGAAICTEGSVHAFEMDPKCIPLIKRNIELNSFKNVTLTNAAVADKSGTEFIPIKATPDPQLMLVGKDISSKEGYLEIPSISLDEYVKQTGIEPNLIKIDAEGAEYFILKGMSALLESNQLKVLVEIHCKKLEKFGKHFSDVLTLLESKGFSMREVIEHRTQSSTTRKIDSSSQLTGNVMIFASK